MKYSDLLKGVGNIDQSLELLNLMPSMPRAPLRKPKTPKQVNQELTEALSSDWEAVGNDLRVAMDKVDQELAKAGIKSPRDRS